MNRRSFISGISGLFAASRVAQAAEPDPPAPMTATEVMIQEKAEAPRLPFAYSEVTAYALEDIQVGDALAFDWAPGILGSSITGVRPWSGEGFIGENVWGCALERAKPGGSLRVLLQFP